MARTLNPAAHTVKREAFMDAALRLIRAKGYEQMSVQDVLDEVEASRGAFYHYFDSKQALLEAVVERFADEGIATLAPVLNDPDLSAIQRLERVIGGIARFKAESKDLVLEFVNVWMSDDNAIVREKIRRIRVRLLAPLLSALVREGIEEGLFAASSPDDTAQVLVALMDGFSEVATRMFIDRQANAIPYEAVQRAAAANIEAFERILGAAPGSVRLLDEPTMREWFG
jgi:AcrR family transcriptional regulator